MTNLNTTASHQPETACGSHVSGVVARILVVLERVVDAFRSRREAEHLASLGDYLLKDIGITRNDIDAVVRRGRLPF